MVFNELLIVKIAVKHFLSQFFETLDSVDFTTYKHCSYTEMSKCTLLLKLKLLEAFRWASVCF